MVWEDQTMPRKGQPCTQEAIAQMRKAKLARFLRSVDWALAEPYLDTVLDLSSRNRSLKSITLREYKTRMLAGQNMFDMIADGVSKHLLKFFSNLVQGKIHLDQNTFAAEYQAGATLEDMAKKHGLPREDITYLRQLYGVKTTGFKFQNRKATESPLTQKQKEILYGSLMGDAKRMSPSSAGFGHGTHQMEYLAWKFREFDSVASKKSWKQSTATSKVTGRLIHGWRFYTHANTDIERIISQFYASGTKQITREILDNLTPLSVAVWFQDDGKTDFYYRFKEKGGKRTPTPVFCTESFSKESCEEMQKWFEEKYQIQIRLKALGTIGLRCIVCNESVQDFFDIIRPHVLPMFQYKIDYDAYVAWRKMKEERDAEEAGDE